MERVLGGKTKWSGSLEYMQTINETEGAFNWKLQVNEELQWAPAKGECL